MRLRNCLIAVPLIAAFTLGGFGCTQPSPEVAEANSVQAAPPPKAAAKGKTPAKRGPKQPKTMLGPEGVVD
jgi:hypothetical protein